MTLNGGKFKYEVEKPPLKENIWYALVCGVSVPESKVRVYLNGQVVGETDLPKGFQLSAGAKDKVWSFANSNSGNRFDGRVDDLVIYDRLLTVDEMADIPLRYTENLGQGKNALQENTSGDFNTALGVSALQFNATGGNNTAVGAQAIRLNTTGDFNLALGSEALKNNVTGVSNTAVGKSSLSSNTTGSWNVAVGLLAIKANTTGHSNTAIGTESLLNNTTGGFNIAIGDKSGNLLTTGSHNIVIGHPGLAAEEKTIRLGNSENQTRAFLAGVVGVTTGANDAVPVMIDSTGQLGTVSSSRRFKEDIHDLSEAETQERLQSLRPVTFRYKQAFNDGAKPVQYGLIAEEVAEVFPELVVFNQAGQPETVKYHLLTPLLLQQVQEQQAQLQQKEQQLQQLEQRLLKLEAAMSKDVCKNNFRTMDFQSVENPRRTGSPSYKSGCCFCMRPKWE